MEDHVCRAIEGLNDRINRMDRILKWKTMNDLTATGIKLGLLLILSCKSCTSCPLKYGRP
jgi:hypothetical protein